LSLGDRIADEQNPRTFGARFNREIRSAKSVQVQAVDLAKSVRFTLEQQLVVHEAAPNALLLHLRVSSHQQLIADAIETHDVGQRKHEAEQQLLPDDNGDNDESESDPSNPGMPRRACHRAYFKQVIPSRSRCTPG
jgi:hypothetical protein